MPNDWQCMLKLLLLNWGCLIFLSLSYRGDALLLCSAMKAIFEVEITYLFVSFCIFNDMVDPR
jgi:hypothetical protein